jgi:Ca2+-binding RTX toxin-like protein
MASPVRLILEELESRDAPAVLAYTALMDNGADVITVQLSDNGNKIAIYDDGDLVESMIVGNVDSVEITAGAAEGDSLVVDYSFGAFSQAVSFVDPTSGAAANVTNTGGSLDFSASTQAVSAVIGPSTTTATFASGGGVSVVATVDTVIGTSEADTLTDETGIALLTLDGGFGDDTYVLSPGSTIAITDDGGSDTLNFGANGQAITATIGTDDSTITDLDGLVTFDGTLESLIGTAADDTYTDNTTVALLTLNDADGNDTYFLNPGSTIDVTDSGGNDTLNFGANGQAITANIGASNSTITDADGDVTFAGTAEQIVGTSQSDTYSLIPLSAFIGIDITITDAGGIADTLDFSSIDQAIVANMLTTSATVTFAGGLVTVVGTTEAVVGTAQNDLFIDEGEVNFVFSGGGGSDTYDLEPGSNITINESGNDKDSILLGRANHGVNANLATGVITDTNGNNVFINGQVENLEGTEFTDVIVGNAADNILYGGLGNDVLNGDGGNDTYILIAGGNDVITDSSGVDMLDFSQTTTSGVVVDLSRTNGSSQNIAPGAMLALNGVIERVIGTNQADVLSGGSGDDVLVGLGGNDRLMGQSGNDILLGGAGNDELNGGSGRDILVGGIGADRLNGNAGEDILIAGYTAYDAGTVDLTAWTSIFSVWVGSGTPLQRVTAIRAGVGPSGQYTLHAAGPNQTVFDDGNPDILTGGQSTDWYFAAVPGNDTITDKDNQEFLNDLPLP